MPELPEVETVKLGLARLLPGKSIKAIEYDWPKSFPNSKNDVDVHLIDSEITNVRRRAKVLIIDLSSDYSLVTHLKMTGQLVFRNGKKQSFGAGHPNDSLIGELPDRSTRVIIGFTDDSHLYFNDQRKFGWMRLIPTAEVEQMDFIKKLGPEPLEPDYNWRMLKAELKRRSRSPIKAALLDQTVVAGIGNIYADESLWGAKIHPANMTGLLSDAKLKKLVEEIQYVLRLSIQKGGSTDKNYVDAEGRKGSYMLFARVFRREDQPCPRCGRAIVKTRLAGRGTHFCPHCQKPPKTI